MEINKLIFQACYHKEGSAQRLSASLMKLGYGTDVRCVELSKARAEWRVFRTQSKVAAESHKAV